MSERGTSHDNKDAYLDMITRRAFSNFTPNRVDFNYAGIVAARDLGALGAGDVLLDVGSSSCEFAAAALRKARVPARLIGLDPLAEPYQDFLPERYKTNRLGFIQGKGEAIPLADNSVNVTTLHNVYFRATDGRAMLAEIKRVTRPEGHIIISTNAKDHAPKRHTLEHEIAQAVAAEIGQEIEPLTPPAEGYYLEDLPTLIANAGGLTQVGQTLEQVGDTVITPGKRFNDFIQSLLYSANHTPLPPKERWRWRRYVAEHVALVLREEMRQNARQDAAKGVRKKPYFTDTIHRGMLVFRNDKE